MKLNIGGLVVKEGWKILNIQKDEGIDFIGDISDLSRFEDNSIEEIYASHVVEHVPKDKVEITLKGIHKTNFWRIGFEAAPLFKKLARFLFSSLAPFF